MKDYSDPGSYWESRLRADFTLTGAGHRLLGACYNRRLYRARREALDRALHRMRMELRGSKVLDVGCGTGFYTEYFLQRGVDDYVGIDVASISVRELRERYPQFRFEQADITKHLPSNMGAFDLVLAADVLFHIGDDDSFAKAIENMAARVEVGGLLTLTDVFPAITEQEETHVRFRALGEYQARLRAVDLVPAHVEPIFGVLHPPAAIRGMGREWKAYATLWRLLWPLVRRLPLGCPLAHLLGWADDRCLRARIGTGSPSTKWLLCEKRREP